MAMPPDRVDHAISFLTGQVHALFLFSQALAHAHPHPRAVLANLDEAEQAGLANIEAQAVDEAVIEGYRFALAGIRKAVEAAAGRPHVPKRD